MTVYELGEAYLRNAVALRCRISELRTRLRTEQLTESEKILLRRRICVLESMARDSRATGRYLKRYYNGQNTRKA